jgi:SAM-dependent methyltransferase
MTTLQTLDRPSPSNDEASRRDIASTAFHNGWRGRLNAWFFVAFDRYIAHISRELKSAAFGDLQPGTIVEIGPGVGANFDFVPAGSRVIAIEPNLAMHRALEERAGARGVDLELHAAFADRMPLETASVDDVLCSLVLCTVDDQAAVLAEIRRVLRPGGRLRFVEHVAAPPWSPRRWLQHLIRRPWSWIYEGCDLCRDTSCAVHDAGFSRVQIAARRLRRSLFIPVNTTIHGVATK